MGQLIVSISGLRGIMGETLFPKEIVRYAEAFARYVGGKRIVIGRDGRLFGDLIERIVESTLLMCGCEVVNLGVAPSPTISLAVEKLKAKGGISITASHNPQEWNGMKFLNSKGIFLDKDEHEEFMKYLDIDNDCANKRVKQIEYYPKFSDYHINYVLNNKYVDRKKIRRRRFKVVTDCVNSSGSFMIPKLLQKLGCKVIKFNCGNTGIFKRNPEPLPENIKQTCRQVVKHKANLGVVVDPDADRLVLITERGEPFGEEYTIATAVNYVLRKTPKSRRVAVVNHSTTRAVEDIVNNLGGELCRSSVGEINVIKKMKECNAVIGGEGSGGVILPFPKGQLAEHYSRDSLVGIALVLSEFAEFDGKVSEYKCQLPQYHIIKDKININNVNVEEIIRFISSKYSSCAQDNEDGLKVDMGSERGVWFNLRKSNTEPIIRMIAEARTEKEAKGILLNLRNEVVNYISSLNI